MGGAGIIRHGAMKPYCGNRERPLTDGGVSMAARRKKCRADGPTTGHVGSGKPRSALRSRLMEEEAEAIRREAHAVYVQAVTPRFGVPFYSDAMLAWRVTFELNDPLYPGGVFSSSIWTKYQEDATTFYQLAHDAVQGKGDWQGLRERARLLADSQQEGVIAHLNRTV